MPRRCKLRSARSSADALRAADEGEATRARRRDRSRRPLRSTDRARGLIPRVARARSDERAGLATFPRSKHTLAEHRRARSSRRSASGRRSSERAHARARRPRDDRRGRAHPSRRETRILRSRDLRAPRDVVGERARFPIRLGLSSVRRIGGGCGARGLARAVDATRRVPWGRSWIGEPRAASRGREHVAICASCCAARSASYTRSAASARADHMPSEPPQSACARSIRSRRKPRSCRRRRLRDVHDTIGARCSSVCIIREAKGSPSAKSTAMLSAPVVLTPHRVRSAPRASSLVVAMSSMWPVVARHAESRARARPFHWGRWPASGHGRIERRRHVTPRETSNSVAPIVTSPIPSTSRSSGGRDHPPGVSRRCEGRTARRHSGLPSRAGSSATVPGMPGAVHRPWTHRPCSRAARCSWPAARPRSVTRCSAREPCRAVTTSPRCEDGANACVLMLASSVRDVPSCR